MAGVLRRASRKKTVWIVEGIWVDRSWIKYL